MYVIEKGNDHFMNDGECINGSKDSEKTYVEALTMGMSYWPSDYNEEGGK